MRIITEKIDIVFSDVVMPHGMSGIELAEEIAFLPNAPKVLLTSGNPIGFKDVKKHHLDALNIIAKPF